MILSEVKAASLQLDAWAADRAVPMVRAARPAGSGLALRLQGVGKSFGARQVLKGIDLQIEPGEFVAIVGRSGCRKSTLLRLLAGLEGASASAWRWRARWCTRRACCCRTNRWARWTR